MIFLSFLAVCQLLIICPVYSHPMLLQFGFANLSLAFRIETVPYCVLNTVLPCVQVMG
jgi:hypothetical protein